MNTENCSENPITFRPAFEAETDLQQYPSNALSMFALSLYLRLEDVHEFAADAITEGPGDCKVDICYLDESESRAIVVQSYFSPTWGKAAAPANKASDLNTAVSWLLSASEDLIPSHLRPKAVELRRALANGDVEHIEILFIHNCYESENVKRELKTAADAARDIARALIGDSKKSIVVSYKEIGLRETEELYKTRDSDILIDDWMEIPASVYVEEQGQNWKAILTTVSGDWIQNLHRRHRDRLFSANYRDYLGFSTRKENINYQITQTAKSEPVNFWVYNNGITALTHELELGDNVRIRGISIINGAQTTGALSEAPESAASETKVLIRIVECHAKELIDKIIQYNNTQNEIKPADRRSNDPTQRRLRVDFSQYEVAYVHRRSATRSPRNAISAASIAPALCAFHGDPQTALRNKKEIFNNDDVYQKVFPSNIRVEHVFLVTTLSSAISQVKTELKRKITDEVATDLEEREYEALKHSASKHFLFFLIGFVAEEIMQRRISDLHEWKCRPEVISADNKSMVESWVVAVRTLLPQITTIVERKSKDAFYNVPRNMELSKQVAQELKALIASLTPTLGNQFEEVRRRTSV